MKHLSQNEAVSRAKDAALNVLLNNCDGPFHRLPRTAAWGYPEPYTRDLMIAGLGAMTTGHPRLMSSLRRVLETLAKNQTKNGHIPSLVHDPEDRGASDTTPLFLLTLAVYRNVVSEPAFLEAAAQKALLWMRHQSPSDRILVSQMPTSDWRDEQWVMGFGLYVNALVHAYLQLHGQHERAGHLKKMMSHSTVDANRNGLPHQEGLTIKATPYYALWSYKHHNSDRFDLLGNSLAILSGLASPSRARAIVTWVEIQCDAMRERNELGADLPPNFFPFIKLGDSDWRPRYIQFNKPGEYHNGGIWPFVCGFYIAAAVAAGKPRIARKNLAALTAFVGRSANPELEFGFNEWHRAADGQPAGQDWQTWSAAMYLYAAACVEQNEALFFP